jgi:hypothetical protein
MCKVIAVLALVALASAAPVITLDLDESVKKEQTKHTGGYGVGCASNAKFCRKVATNPSESKYVHSCIAGKSSTANCPLPTAVGYDHHEGDISSKVTYKTYLVNKNGSPHSGAACADKNCINYNLRSEWVTKFDLCDSSSNCADTVVFANILNDIEAPIIEPATVHQIQACSGSSNLPVATAKDNCNSAGVCSKNFDQAVSVVVTPASVKTDISGKCHGISGTASWSTKDNAGMFGASGNDNTAAKGFRYTIKDTVNPVCKASAPELDVECLKDQHYDLTKQFKPKCTDACGMKGRPSISITNSYPMWPHATSATAFTFTQSDNNCNVGTISSKIMIIDTTPPVLKISDGGMHHMAKKVKGKRCAKKGEEFASYKDRTCTVHRTETGHRHLIKCSLRDKSKCPKMNAMVAFSESVARELGYEWASQATIKLAFGRKAEKKLVDELMSPKNGYKCTDACGGNAVKVTIHRNTAKPTIAMDCGSLAKDTAVKAYDWNFPGLHFIKYTCTDKAGLQTTKCRTLDNHNYKNNQLAYIQVPSTVSTKELKDTNVEYFKKDFNKHLNVMERDITAKTGELKLDGTRRLLESCPTDKTCYRMDTFRFATMKPGAVAKALLRCEYEIFLREALKLTCAPLEAEDPTFVCVEVEVEPPSLPGAPLIIVPDPVLMELEAYSNWDDKTKPSPQDPDLVAATKAYCIDPCDLDNPLDCPGRLVLGKRTVIEIPASDCVDDKDPDIEYPVTTTITETDGVNMDKLGEYTVVYTCEKVIGGVSYMAVEKERVIKVIDTTKPVCATPTTKVTREASFPYSPDVPVCKDTYWGAQSKQPATVTTGTFNVEKTGNYVLTYTATDHSGNVAPTVKQTIVVVDTLKPVIELSYGAKKFHRTDALDKGVNKQKNPVHKPL